MGKYLRAKELRAELVIDRSTRLKKLPPYLDTGDLVVIIGNLIENALDAVRKATPEKRKVFFSMLDNPESLSIAVRDMGPGIADNNLNNIFERGYTTKGPKNLGIGLYLVKRYVELAGGSIFVNCPKEGGAEFSIFIPKVPSDFEEEAEGQYGVKQNHDPELRCIVSDGAPEIGVPLHAAPAVPGHEILDRVCIANDEACENHGLGKVLKGPGGDEVFEAKEPPERNQQGEHHGQA